jgi:hypothetical protein
MLRKSIDKTHREENAEPTKDCQSIGQGIASGDPGALCSNQV